MMQRRKFLGLFGAAVTAPFVPAPAFAAAAQKVTYSPAAVHAAIYYAQSRAVFSVWGLSKAANLNVAQAELLMGDLAKRGVLGPLQGTTYGGRWATSKVLLSDKLALTKARRLAREKKLTVEANQKRFTQPDLSKLIAHLRGICLDNGMTLHPRCAA
jgi:hypothetical protein